MDLGTQLHDLPISIWHWLIVVVVVVAMLFAPNRFLKKPKSESAMNLSDQALSGILVIALWSVVRFLLGLLESYLQKESPKFTIAPIYNPNKSKPDEAAARERRQ